MYPKKPGLVSPSIILFLFSLCLDLKGQVNVLSQHNDLKRTGWNAQETQLTQASVSNGNFGMLFSRTVDDQMYSQPLVVSGVNISGTPHNIVIVATVNNSLYAFDADNVNVTAPYWQQNLTYNPGNTNAYRAIVNTDMTGCGAGYRDFSGNMGIVGTPVIDASSKTLYVVARSVTKSGPPTFVQYLHAIDITTGLDKIPPVYITATIPGTGAGSVGGSLTFNQQRQNQRPGLLLYNNVIYISWASHCDWGPYNGWVIGYDAGTLAQKYVYNDSPDGTEAGIWMSGQAPAVDDNGFIYVTTGNGTAGTNADVNDPVNRGESLLKLSNTSGNLQIADFFTPSDYGNLNALDEDYGCDGVLLLPNTNLSLSGSKAGYLYLIDNTNMGKTTTDNSNVLQLLDINATFAGSDKHVHGSPAYFKDNSGNEFIYAWAEGGLLKQFPFSRTNMLFDIPNLVVGNTALPFGMPGGMLAVSSNGSQAGTGILWASHPINGDANSNVVPGILQAFDATDVTHELWNSNLTGSRDAVGKFAKFVCPTIANGKVYLATFSNQLNVYGLNPPPASACSNTLPAPMKSADIGYVQQPGDACYANGVYTITGSGTDMTGTKDAFHSVYQSAASSNMQITARIVSIDGTDADAKSGVMFRASLDPGAPEAFMAMSYNNGAVLAGRTSQNGNINSQTHSAPANTAYWVRLVSNGNTYTGSISPDGSTWTTVGTITAALGSFPYIGIGYTDIKNYVLGTTVVDNVSILDLQAPLPVNLTDFKAFNISNEYTQLNWSTASEINSDHFDIERSTNTTDFVKIGTTFGNGNTSVAHQYNFKDEQPADGNNYYRLKQVDKDGKFQYSPVVHVTFNLSIIKIYPNPAIDHITLVNNSNFSNGLPLIVSLKDQLGKPIYEQTIPTDGVDQLTFTIPASVGSGIYILSVTNSIQKVQAWKITVKK